MIERNLVDKIQLIDYSKKGINIYYYKDSEFVHRRAVIRKEELERLLSEVPDGHTYKLVLECSTVGDVRFSAFGAKARAFGVEDFIEFFYQLSKGFEGQSKPDINDPWHKKMDYTRMIKSKKPDYMDLGGQRYDVRLLSQWYHLLWIRYLDANPELVEYLKLFDDYNDVFKGKSLNCQADSIRKYVKNGRESLLIECDELNGMFKSKIR